MALLFIAVIDLKKELIRLERDSNEKKDYAAGAVICKIC